MSMGFSGIKGAPAPQGSSRLVDISHDPSNVPSFAFGPSQVLGTNAPKSIQQNSLVRGPWAGPGTGLSGANKDRQGGIFEFLSATSFNIGIFANFSIPIVGRGPTPPKTPPEMQDYWALEIMLGQGQGLAQSGFTPHNPPFVPVVDAGVFFFPQDSALSASTYGGFTDLDGNGSCAGYGLFIGNDGKWHWGVRITRSGGATPLDVDVPLNFDPTNPAAWPTTAANADQLVRTKWEWFASRNGQKPVFQLTIGNNPPLIKTTIADIGTTPVPAGLATELPDGFSQSSDTYGWVGCTRAGPGTTSGNAAGAMTTNGVQATGATTLSIAIAGPSGQFFPGDQLVIAGQTFLVAGLVAIPAAAVTAVPVNVAVGAPIAGGVAVAYTAEPQTLGIKMLAHVVAGPNVPSTVLA